MPTAICSLVCSMHRKNRTSIPCSSDMSNYHYTICTYWVESSSWKCLPRPSYVSTAKWKEALTWHNRCVSVIRTHDLEFMRLLRWPLLYHAIFLISCNAKESNRVYFDLMRVTEIPTSTTCYVFFKVRVTCTHCCNLSVCVLLFSTKIGSRILPSPIWGESPNH